MSKNKTFPSIRINSIGSKLFIYVLSTALLSLGGMAFLFYKVSEDRALEQIQVKLAIRVRETQNQLEQSSAYIGGFVLAVQNLRKLGTFTTKDYENLALEFFTNRPDSSIGLGLGQTPYGLIPQRQWYYPYFYINENKPVTLGRLLPPPYKNIYQADLFKEDNYPQQDYYKLPVATRQPLWTEPYQWFGFTIVSYMQPIIDEKGKVIGVAGADVDTDALSTWSQGKVTKEGGYFVLLSPSGKLLAYPPEPEKAIRRDSYQTVPVLAKLWTQIQGTEEGIILTDDAYIAYQRIQGANWFSLAIVPKSLVLVPLLTITLTNALGAGIILALVIALFVRHLNARLDPLVKECEKITGSGDRDSDDLLKPIDYFAKHDEIELLSLAFHRMVERLQAYFTALETVNKQLEQRVAERTSELQTANQEIFALNQLLTEENLRMGAELKVTRQLQQTILPKESELKQNNLLDIAAFMEPATEVGGDYYDVLAHQGCLKIGIGDVTGHGLESGILMIMVQTAVRTLLNHGETNPIKFLSTINTTIFDNVQRMNSPKNLTLAILDYQEGILKLSGQHEELILVRSTGEIERIDTIDLGFPIGLEANIDDFISQTQVNLRSGDVVVLYTDGVTEARNLTKELYGLERLGDVVKQNLHNSAETICCRVIESLRNHIGDGEIDDDITLLILKQK
ncbi:MAG: SpoIIE family protein phosphatase [Microcoleus sp. PH2017_10_PVI_O_A]|uniref:SpoIIE family protein phosphatase n=1 Tax=unclassified Microcoleus TaxID=2642155 RepID=UPI001D8EAF4A|nr:MULTISPECIES: SpoIIE family protein phosphatase [unclassified Microcoleus]TAE80381.1 MAG: serine/threonine protein phosphatase [Oscillatoriales cyanobacterium]MCC3407075.1 SpoIIE family protein phosphatase [Microcoleus sp. PH2017_10_PVI_O_A]MCC3461823.1 SpoIIE family protein phosphatase [Microcoleus sp. PH2017_11_PCY_U_A]MCC3477976.1 SpoIIE family protein phosphatase [Microcoleus sp. PH2017_12_PCY_D_A]MCC3529084.1 SpoIIE family protein phosphatase [Microcoleus sp. PH2017_21_RUC_O_A]